MLSLSDSDVRSSFTARALRRNRRILLGIAICVWLVAIPMCIGAAATMDLQFAAMAAGITAAAILFARAYLQRRDVLKSPLIRLIRERPDQIVWIYLRQDVVTGLGSNETVHVHALPGQIFLLYSLEASRLMAELTAWCPYAHAGWSRALDDAWTRDPASLRRGAV